MKKSLLKIIMLIFAFTLFAGCAREEFTDLYGFTQRFTYMSISPEDFFTEKDKNTDNIYYTFFENETASIMLKLIASTGENKINEIRIYLPKYDENANKKEVSTQGISLFLEVTRYAAEAFTLYEKSEIEEILNQMKLYEKSSYNNEGELTKTKNNFYFIYHSSSLGSEFKIYNTYLKEVEATEKPESKPLYGDTTKIRTETAPIK